jgi:hypothetical protein
VCEKIRVYIQFLEELGIRIALLTLKFIIKSFLGTDAFQFHQKDSDREGYFSQNRYLPVPTQVYPWVLWQISESKR